MPWPTIHRNTQFQNAQGNDGNFMTECGMAIFQDIHFKGALFQRCVNTLLPMKKKRWSTLLHFQQRVQPKRSSVWRKLLCRAKRRRRRKGKMTRQGKRECIKNSLKQTNSPLKNFSKDILKPPRRSKMKS